MAERDDRREFCDGLQNVQKRIGSHLFVCNQQRKERNADNLEQKHEKRELESPVRRRHSDCFDIQHLVEHRNSDCFGKRAERRRQQNMKRQRTAENAGDVTVLPSDFKRNETLGRAHHRIAQKGEEDDNASDDVVDSVIFDSKHIQQDSGGVERDCEQEYHADVENNRILRNPLCIVRIRHVQ